jgi:hypothetical protein
MDRVTVSGSFDYAPIILMKGGLHAALPSG